MLRGNGRYAVAAVACIFAINASISRATLIAHWAANGDTVDSVGGHDGTLKNGAGYDAGRFGQAFRFDGRNDYIAVADDNIWTFGGDFTLATWVNFDTVKQGSMGRLPNVFMGHDQGPYSRPKWVFAHDGRGRLFFHINGNGSVFLAAPNAFNPTPGTWHHVAVTRSADTYTFYADGESMGSITDSRSLPNANAALTFGQAEGLGYLDGRLDDLRIYDSAVPPSIPEPATLSLLAIGGLAALRRRHTTGRAIL